MPFPHFSGPYIFRMLTKAFTWKVLRRLPEKVVRGKSYAVCSFFGSAQLISEARPTAFFEEVLCRLLIFRVRTPFGV